MKKKKTKQQKVWGFLKFQIVLIIIVLIGIAYYYIGGYGAKIAQMKQSAVSYVQKSDEETFRSIETSEVYDCNNQLISVMKGEKDVYYLELKDIPIYAQEAMISVEDKKFYQHSGVDYKAILRAVWAMIQNGEVTQGGSTITQQLARNLFLTQDRTWERKIEEIYIASELEKKYTKEEILEFYLNNIYFGNGYYGIQAASKGYFNCDVNALSLSQIAYLCGIPNNPSVYDPMEHPDKTKERRDKILRNMYEDKIISKTTYQNALKEQIVLNQPKKVKNNYLETFTYYCATRALMEQDGFEFCVEFSDEKEKEAYLEEYRQSYEKWNQSLFTGGYRIYTSLDIGMEEKLQQSIDFCLGGFSEVSEEGIYMLQSAAVCIDNSTGMVKAIVGGRSQDFVGYSLNRGYQSFRQPGSAIKPLIVYTPLLERGYHGDSIVRDERIENGPENYDNSYVGNMTLRSAVQWSKNTVAWKLFEELTPKVGISYLKAMDFAKLDINDERLPASIGGFTNGVSPLEMAKAYATIENDGRYREPTCIMKITDAQGNLVYQSQQIEKVVYQEGAAREMTDILQTVVKAGTARGISLGNMKFAGKTGTTNEKKDGWFVGYTPYYTTSVWVGYDQPKRVEGLAGATYPATIWQGFMNQIHEGLPEVDFLEPITYYGTTQEVENNE